MLFLRACHSRRASPLTTEFVTRIAPTPSGYLHAGNLMNFLLVDRVASELGAKIALRIDDLDVFRMRPEYVEDIFRCLRWLEIEWQSGPQSMAEYEQLALPEDRADRYFEAMESMIANGLPAFVCKCSRRDLGRDARCEAGCDSKQLKLVEGKTWQASCPTPRSYAPTSCIIRFSPRPRVRSCRSPRGQIAWSSHLNCATTSREPWTASP